MDIQTRKIEFVQAFLQIQNETIISRFEELLKSEQEDFWLDLSPSQQKEAILAIEQLNKGKKKKWEDIRSNAI